MNHDNEIMPDKETDKKETDKQEDSEFGFNKSDELDPELLVLPDPPPRYGKLIFMNLILIGTSIFLIYWFWFDFVYYFSNKTPIYLGFSGSIEWSKARDNIFVEVDGVPWQTKTVKYETRLNGLKFWKDSSKEFYNIFPLIGEKKILVRYHRVEGKNIDVLPGSFSGRLVKVGKLKGFSTIKHFLVKELNFPVTNDTWVVIDGEPPSSYLMYLVLYCILGILLIINSMFLIKILIKIIKNKK